MNVSVEAPASCGAVVEAAIDGVKTAMTTPNMKISCVRPVPTDFAHPIAQVLNMDPELTAVVLPDTSQIQVSSSTMLPIRMQAMIEAVVQTVMAAQPPPPTSAWTECALQLPRHLARVLHAGLCQQLPSGIRGLQPMPDQERRSEAEDHEKICFQTTLNEAAIRKIVNGILRRAKECGVVVSK